MVSLTDSERFVESSMNFKMDQISSVGYSSRFSQITFPTSTVTYDSNLTNTLTRKIDKIPKSVSGVGKGTEHLSGQASAQTYGTATALKGYVTDYITPTLTELEIWADNIAGKQIAKTIERTLVAQVKKKYKNENSGTWKANKPGWKKIKRNQYNETRVMHLHDHRPEDAYVPEQYLANTVQNFGNKISVVQTGDEQYAITGIDEEFAFNPYVWFHEVGTSIYPARPFITPAMQEAVQEGMRVVTYRHPINRMKSGRIKPMAYTVGDETFQIQYQKGVSKSMSDMLLAFWWFFPQVDELRYLGIAHDVSGYMSGHFVDLDTVKHFTNALAMGKAGQMSGLPFTPKLARRASRKSIWGKQNVSILRGT